MLTPGPTLGHGSVRSSRTYGFFAAAVLLAVIVFGGAQGSLFAPLVGWITMDRTDPRFVHDVTVSAVLLVAFVGALAQVVRPARNVVAALLLAVVVTGIAGVVLLTGGVPSILVLPALAAVLLALHPSGSVVPRVAVEAVERWRLLLAAGAALPLFLYGVGQALRLLSRSDADAALGRPGGMALVALTTVVASLLAVTETPGHRFATWSAGLLAGTLGLASVVVEGSPGVGTVWGVLAVVWAVAFVYTGRRRRADGSGGLRRPTRRRRRETD